jgi:uncharacterized protein (TIGR00661 family)
VEELRSRHEVTLFTFGDAYALLRPVYRNTSVRVRPIHGPRFAYRALKLDYLRTGIRGIRYVARVLPEMVDLLSARILREKPDLVITDLEPALPRAALRCGVPFVSLNHQHFLVVNDLSSLPARLRWYGEFLGAAVRGFHQGQVKTIVSSFYAPPLKPGYKDKAVQVGVLLRPEVLFTTPYSGGYFVAYLRRFVGQGVLDALKACPQRVLVYGLGERPPQANLTFRRVSAEAFLDDLAGCEALITTAGNQIVGEALYLEKPVLAVPEPGNFEQRINAHFLKESGAGDWSATETLSPAVVRGFLDRLDLFRAAICPETVNGTPAVLRAIQPFLA